MPTQIIVNNSNNNAAEAVGVANLNCKEVNDLPQDQLPFSPNTNINDFSTPRENDTSKVDSIESPSAAANVTADSLKLNLNESIVGSKDNSPREVDVTADVTAESIYNLEKEALLLNETVESIHAELEELNLSITGQRLETKANASNDDVEDSATSADEDVAFDVSGKDFIKVVHGNRNIMLVMPSEVRA